MVHLNKELERVGVVGCGLMGSGIAEVCATAGLDVLVREVDDDALQKGRSRIETSLARAVQRGKLDAEIRELSLERLRFTRSLEDFQDRQVVFEAVVEQEAAKVSVFSALDDIVEDEEAILASNTSSIPIMKLGMVTQRPEHVVGIHFFNPVPILQLVELVSSLLTDPAVTDRAEEMATGILGKKVIRSQDRAGFVVNALLVPYLLSAVRMLESGFARPEDIDLGMVVGCAHPLGPLHLSDLIGLDTLKAIAESMYDEFKEPLYSPPPMLLRMVDAGLLGRKSGRGFFNYTDHGS